MVKTPATERSSDRPSEDLRSFGRRRGRKHSARQEHLLREVLPRVALDVSTARGVVAETLSAGASDVWLEIGFGSGEHLLGRAAEHPGICCIGCEPFQDGVVKVLDAIETGGRENIRLYSDDARDLLRVLPPGSIGRAFVLFPDPWPKRRHVKRRLLSRRTFTLLAGVMRSGAELRIATDIGDYATGILLAAHEEGSFHWRASGASSWRERPAGWIRTRYEEKAMAAGRRCYFFSFERR
ncbi:MAG: tRNA (guanosine(46)-N7)-methyltransferase TrmB [Sphingomonadales bacterium]|nr:tRNA (guanosine(46)-N7)-methyltransferase TrmB [Sphingomonadales bacterium]